MATVSANILPRRPSASALPSPAPIPNATPPSASLPSSASLAVHARHPSHATTTAVRAVTRLISAKRRRHAKLRHRSMASAASAASAASTASAMDPPVLSFYGAEPVPLPSRFLQIKRRLAASHHDALRQSWTRLLVALAEDMRELAARGAAVIPSIAFAQIDDAAATAPFAAALKKYGVGIVRGVVPPADATAWARETLDYLAPAPADSTMPAADGAPPQLDIKPPSPQDRTCFDLFWTPAQVRARAHPNVLRALQFAMRFWAPPATPGAAAVDDPRVATRFPIVYADRIRIHASPDSPSLPVVAATRKKGRKGKAQDTDDTDANPSPNIIAQVDGGSLERWEPDGYGRGGTYDAIFAGCWEAYDPWDPAGRVQATPDLYNGAGACSVFRMSQGLLALADVAPGMVRLLPSPKLATAYFLLRPFFRPKAAAPETTDTDDPEAWAAFLAPANWELEDETSTVIHGAVPGHAQRVTERWHPHLRLRSSLVAPPPLQAGDYILWHCDTPYTIDNAAPAAAASSPAAALPPMLAYIPACPLTQTNALYLARQRKAFLRGHPGPDFDASGSGLGSEAGHAARLGEAAIEAAGGLAGLRAMGLAPWPGGGGGTSEGSGSSASSGSVMDEAALPLSRAEREMVRLANIILFPDQYEFYMPTRTNSPDR